MATIKAIEGRSVHQIQSGQVIIDLCSVVKELVENSLDAGATSIDVRFKNNGLDSIEVQDNGAGIFPDDYETIALKHYTSKLFNYDDLGTLNTFGFRGEALSSLCALSRFHIVTARAEEAPRGKRLDFETSGKLKSTTIAASPKGTTVAVEDLFHNLHVRRHELEKSVKREYGKVLGILHAYACISTGVKFGVSNQMPRGRKMVVFSTKANMTTKDNIANVFGAKTLPALIPLELELELQPTTNQALTGIHSQHGISARNVKVAGHISRPVFGEGRQTPDRQMFFVNSRPCGLPQISKAFNEVYKSFNVSQSPFIFANLIMDTNAYDVNVSPDKRTILLHDQTALLESMKDALMKMFEAQEQTVPQSQLTLKKLPAFRPLTMSREATTESEESNNLLTREDNVQGTEKILSSNQTLTLSSSEDGSLQVPTDLLSRFVAWNHLQRQEIGLVKTTSNGNSYDNPSSDKQTLARTLAEVISDVNATSDDTIGPMLSVSSIEVSEVHASPSELPRAVQDFNARIASQSNKSMGSKRHERISLNTGKDIPSLSPSPIKLSTGVVQLAFERMRPRRLVAENATITIGDKTSTAIIGSSSPAAKRRRVEDPVSTSIDPRRKEPSVFAQKLKAFAGPGTQLIPDNNHDDNVSGADERTSINCSMSHDLSPGDEDGAVSNEDTCCSHNSSEEMNNDDNDDDEDDNDYIDEEEKRKLEEARVNKLIEDAQQAAALPTQANAKRIASLLKSHSHKESTLNMVRFIKTSSAVFTQESTQLNAQLQAYARERSNTRQRTTSNQIFSTTSPEERLSLTITRSDFAQMHIIGQFNLGFILATRTSHPQSSDTASSLTALPDDLFIIDQHASDEIYNFTRLSQTTTITPQPLVRPHPLDLTAIEEETILAHTDTFSKNGFSISFDASGASPVGRRCNLLTLPTSRETVFDTRDLEELISLLAETTPFAGEVVRPSRVRRMLAMRACRSSIMVGKTLSMPGMKMVVKHMGEIERPWNCPHGRPTMRHLAGLGEWGGWVEGEGLVGDVEHDGGLGDVGGGGGGVKTDWRRFVEDAREEGLLDGLESGDGDKMEEQNEDEDEIEEDDNDDGHEGNTGEEMDSADDRGDGDEDGKPATADDSSNESLELEM